MTNPLELLKTEFPKNFNQIVRQHKAVNKVISFCDSLALSLFLLALKVLIGCSPDANRIPCKVPLLFA